MSETFSSSFGIPPIQERGMYSIENFSASCRKLSNLPDGILFLRITSRNGIIYYEFLNKIRKDHYDFPGKDIYDQKTTASYSPPAIGRLSGYILALFQEEEKKWLTEDMEGKFRRYIFSMRVQDGKIERIIKEQCIKKVPGVDVNQRTNTTRIRNILGSSISKLPSLIK